MQGFGQGQKFQFDPVVLTPLLNIDCNGRQVHWWLTIVTKASDKDVKKDKMPGVNARCIFKYNRNRWLKKSIICVPGVNVCYHSAEPRDGKIVNLWTDLSIRTTHSYQILIMPYRNGFYSEQKT